MILGCISGSRRWVARGCIGAGLALAAMLAPLPQADAQEYPSRPVKIIVPFPAGGTADVMPRLIGDWLSRKWGQPVVIENKPGAAGNIGATEFSKADPDGYTLLSAPPPPLVINQSLYPKLNFDPTTFEPIIIISRVPNSLVVNPNVNAKTVSDLIGMARERPLSTGIPSGYPPELAPDPGEMPCRSSLRPSGPSRS